MAIVSIACNSAASHDTDVRAEDPLADKVIPTATLNPGPLGDPQETDSLRQIAFNYWEAFDTYDADRSLGYLEKGCRQQRLETLRTDIEMTKRFGAKLKLSEETPAWVVSHDEMEMYLTIKDPWAYGVSE